MRAWEVPSLAFAPAEALRLLTGLPESPPPAIALGASVGYWAEVGKLSLELLAQGLFVPDIEQVDGRQARAVWSPLLGDGNVPARLRVLVAGMPPVCRALVEAGTDSGQRHTARLLESFVKATVDATVRLVAKADFSEAAKQRRRPDTLAERWLAALASDGASLTAPAGELASFLDEVRQWTGQLTPAADASAFRTCFRLEAPEDSQEDGRGGQPVPWSVSFHLQALDDPSLLLDAGTVWKERSGALTFLKRRLENPQERLLADLGRASRLLPALEESLRSPRPVACQLSTEQAYAFLRESALLLEQSGFGVLVPPWWRKPAARLGLRLRVRPKESGKTSGAGLLGLDSLVEFDWEVALGKETLSRGELERLAALKAPLVRVRGQWVELRPQDVEAAVRFFERKQDDMRLAEALRLALPVEGTGVGLPMVAFKAEGWIGRLLGEPSPRKGMEKLAAPRTFQGTLRPYQVTGMSWLAFLDRFGLGACLADDMGLGKTIQLLALLLHERADGTKADPTLLIAPMSVVGNWRREAERFAPSLRVMVHHGGERLSGRAFARQAKGHDVVITTYALAYRDQSQLSSVDWHRVVLDEAQNIKNPSAKQTQALRSLKAGRRVALTGTPVENRLSELWSIMEFLNPGYLGSGQEFRRSYAIPIEKYRNAGSRDRLRHLVQPFILRRLKSDPAIIQDLPEKMESKVLCNLTREQASLYEAVVKGMLEKIEGAEGIGRKGLVLATLTRLKQVCNHPAHFLQDGSPLAGRSGKLLRLEEMLEEALVAGDRALVFTQFAEMGQMLKGYLQEELMREVLFLHGGTPRAARDEMVRRFQAAGPNSPVFVLSLKAGGLGLNLTAASHVFHFDRWWNPAVENQATDRAFRIGQRKNVQVYKYVCAGTLEERIDQMIEQKKELAESVVGAGEAWLTELSTEQLRQVLALSADAVVEA